jgi:large subunit ribosomal protein L18
MYVKPDRKAERRRRQLRVRRKIQGTAERPRLNVFRRLKHMYTHIHLL